jgi:hypothetical protein
MVADGVSVIWKRRWLPFLRHAAAGDRLTPNGNISLVVRSASAPAPSPTAVRAALKDPVSSEMPVLEISPRSGTVMLRISQIAMALGLVYLAGGVLSGIVVPSAVRYASVYYGADTLRRDMPAAKRVISDHMVLKKHIVDEKTKKFFNEMKSTILTSDKDAEK